MVSSDDLVLLVPFQQGQQLALDQFSAACTQAGMKISTRQIEVLCFARHLGWCMLNVTSSTLHQDKTFKYIGTMFTSDGRRNKQIDTCMSERSAVLCEIYYSVFTKRELLNSAKPVTFQIDLYPDPPV